MSVAEHTNPVLNLLDLRAVNGAYLLATDPCYTGTKVYQQFSMHSEAIRIEPLLWK